VDQPATCYLGPERSGVSWLLDPESTELRDIAREATDRTPDSPCDPAPIADDLPTLQALVESRHFGAASGRSDTSGIGAVFAAWQDRVSRECPTTWGQAIGDVQDALRELLVDNHVELVGSRPSRWRTPPPEGFAKRPAVEVDEHAGVLTVTIRRFMGDPVDERALAGLREAADEHFAYDRIVVDLRDNTGGNDAHAYYWLVDRVRADCKDIEGWTGWQIGDVPYGNWNVAAWLEARDGLDAVPPLLLAGRHTPRPDDRLEIADGSMVIEAGAKPWPGRMLVLVNKATMSSGESTAWGLKKTLGARLVGTPTNGCINYGNTVPYILPRSRVVVRLTSKYNDYGFPVELRGFPVDIDLDPATPLPTVAADFDRIWARGD